MIPRTAVFFLGAFLFCVSGVAKAQTKPRVVHVFVALADNEHQGIVPVPAFLGNGDDPARNLYWGAAFGVRTFFKNAPEWREILYFKHPNSYLLERSIFQSRNQEVLLVADAYRGSEIKQALTDFFRAAAGITEKQATSGGIVGGVAFQVPTTADLVVYVGHDGLMDFPLTVDFGGRSESKYSAIILACASRSYFRTLLRASGATPLLWTNGLMAPEAYTLKAALDGWILQESKEEIRKRAAVAYAKYQKCSDVAAMRLFSSDW
ncbi:MAG TPA: hypothetical protein VKH63_14635 [Candidatus Acidoferrum sp.]|nr:hypothetical protein [Candidatus Acidoferrum sp.]